MDPCSSAQDVPLCDYCETTIVHSYCGLCHLSLCKPCVVGHTSDGNDKHTIVPLQERRSTLIDLKCKTELLDEPELVATIQTGYEELRSVACLKDGSIWTSGLTKDIKCFNIEGSLLQTIKQKSGDFPNHIAVDKDGNLLYISDEIKTVYKVRNGQTEELIRIPSKWTPRRLCVTSTGDLLVTMFSDDYTQSKVVRYSGSTEKQTIQFDDEGKPLYSGNGELLYVTENRNHDICVADINARAVVVVNQDSKLRWRYCGRPTVTKKGPFELFGITTDSQSHILTADVFNHCIHILDQDGHFLRYIDNCDLKNPYDLCLDNNENLFVCEIFKGNVKKIKYMYPK
ncbi:uncharacterized protein [Magallana gigas]|uniref:uncharacterized protein n=1 Tax=Magallana gigas TaxID=29159 RepID=UPI00333F82DB